jgi:hypothetical protein
MQSHAFAARETVAPGGRLLYSERVGKTRHLELQRPISNRATWRSGDAADCKSAYPGSIPGVASTFFPGHNRTVQHALQRPGGFVICRYITACRASFPGSSVVEQPAVNRLVAGSNPARGANVFRHLNALAGTGKPAKSHSGNSAGNIWQCNFSERPARGADAPFCLASRRACHLLKAGPGR